MPSKGLKAITDWFAFKGWKPFRFQQQYWNAYVQGKSGLLNAPTGSGKTYAAWFGLLIRYINANPKTFQTKAGLGLQLIWVTPLRALSNDIRKALQESLDDLFIPWQVQIRTGDTPAAMRKKQLTRMPEVIITTPESLHLLLAANGYDKHFKNIQAVVVDEWHELLGTKRGVQTELALSRIKALRPGLQIWGISATIGNLEEAKDVLLGLGPQQENTGIIRADNKKHLNIQSILPDEVENYPWAGYLGIRLLHKVIPVINESSTTLIFTNTRSQCEIWYQYLLDAEPDLAGLIAMHHGSLGRGLRNWVEQALHDERLKAVVCTSSLDLGVDFRPVETIVQVGSPKGVARFLQRAGRSGHQPGATSKIYFLPTHSLELVEAAALKAAIKLNMLESREPVMKPYDVLLQYFGTLAVSNGFAADELYRELLTTHAYSGLTTDEFYSLLDFSVTGGKSLREYDEFKKLELINGKYHITDRRIAMRHRMSIGTIVSETSMRVQFLTGGSLGSIEEYFIAKLKPGDVFWFAGRSLEFVMVKHMTAYVRKAKRAKGIVPSWLGGRMPLSSQLAEMLRLQLHNFVTGNASGPEIRKITPLLIRQQELSALPDKNQFLIEKFTSSEGFHVFMFPFEGRLIHEVMAALIGYRITRLLPITFSIAMNDYGFELLSDSEIPLERALKKGLFSSENLLDDINAGVNTTEMARRKFRDIASIAGLVFQGYPGHTKKSKHLQASSSLLFSVFAEYDTDNLLIRQAYREAFDRQLEEHRLRQALHRIHNQKIIITTPAKPTPLSFPIMVDRLRDKMSSESLEDRVKKMTMEYER